MGKPGEVNPQNTKKVSVIPTRLQLYHRKRCAVNPSEAKTYTLRGEVLLHERA